MFNCFVHFIFLATSLVASSGKRGPCAVKPIPHEHDISDTLFESVDYTEQDILGEDGGVVEDPLPDNDIIPSASNVHYHDLGLRWPNATVPFVFHNMMSAYGRTQLLKAMNEYHRNTCVQFKRRHTEKDYLVIGSSYQVVCASSVGRQGGAQLLHLGPACLHSLGTPLHELMHALGFFHEHMRPDRDLYVYINYSNIDEPLWKNFRALDPGIDMQDLGAGYDFESLMHYRLCAMTNNSWPTIVPKNYRNTGNIGQRKGFSEKDLIKINSFYNCSNVSRRPQMFSIVNSQSINKDNKNNLNRFTSQNTAMFSKSSLLCFVIIFTEVVFYYEYTTFVQYTLCSMNSFSSKKANKKVSTFKLQNILHR